MPVTDGVTELQTCIKFTRRALEREKEKLPECLEVLKKRAANARAQLETTEAANLTHRELMDLVRITKEKEVELKHRVEKAESEYSSLKKDYAEALLSFFKLKRLEHFSNYLRLLLRDKFAAVEAVEQAQAVRIRSMQEQRDREIAFINKARERIAKNAEQLKAVYVLDKRHTTDLTGKGGLVVRGDAVADSELVLMEHYNEEASQELRALLEREAAALKTRAQLQQELLAERQRSKRLASIEVNEIRVLELQYKADMAAIQELNKSNSALTTAIENMMQTLSLEHYGIIGGDETYKAIEDRKTEHLQMIKANEKLRAMLRSKGEVKEEVLLIEDKETPETPAQKEPSAREGSPLPDIPEQASEPEPPKSSSKPRKKAALDF